MQQLQPQPQSQPRSAPLQQPLLSPHHPVQLRTAGCPRALSEEPLRPPTAPAPTRTPASASATKQRSSRSSRPAPRPHLPPGPTAVRPRPERLAMRPDCSCKRLQRRQLLQQQQLHRSSSRRWKPAGPRAVDALVAKLVQAAELPRRLGRLGPPDEVPSQPQGQKKGTRRKAATGPQQLQRESRQRKLQPSSIDRRTRSLDGLQMVQQ